MNSGAYFETQIGFALVQLLPIFPIALLLFILFKFSDVTQYISEILKISSNKFLLGFGFLSCVLVSDSIFGYFKVSHLRQIIDEKKYQMVVGCVKHYNSETSPTNYRTETFVIENTKFQFSNYTQSLYFTGDDHTDNFITEGQCMEISYVRDGQKNHIFKIVPLTRRD
ncbi:MULTISPECIES: hypothetical protein [unclassified Pseudoalteromonas]|uniref:hypothetical protein n=1 Tax=unclassified Pseudoalteromonas TaxID=194690 RepID=UPI000BBE39C6|nr:hypothetical protein [Pseudoalteromonas sp. 1_2015MBL_MicDiv]ATG78018.1 hypothetical protein AOR04_10995 [Pseudoalteromonas sp. 1_2015MBL_MicDiv]